MSDHQGGSEAFLDRIVRIVRQKVGENARQHLETIDRARADLAAVALGEKHLTMLLDEIDRRHTAYINAAASAIAHRDDRAARSAMVRAVRSEHLRAETKAHLDDVVEQRRQVEALIEQMALGDESMSALGPALADLRARALALTDLRKSGAIDAVGAEEFDGGPAIDDAEIERRLCELREAQSEE